MIETEEPVVAKKPGHGGRRSGAGRPKSVRDDVTVKVDREVAAKAFFLARAQGVTLAEYVSEKLRPVVEREFSKAAKPKECKPPAADV